MLRLIEFVVSLFVMLPWWGALGVIGGLIASLYIAGWYIVHRLKRDLVGAALDMGKPMTDAVVQVHSVEPAAKPEGRSAIDGDEDDEDFDPELDGDWNDEGCRFVWVDATISPESPETVWDPTSLTVVKESWKPSEDLEMCLETGIPHTVEVWRDGRFVAFAGGQVTGPQRLHMLFAVPENAKNVKFGYHFTYFGRLTLPVGVIAAC